MIPKKYAYVTYNLEQLMASFMSDLAIQYLIQYILNIYNKFTYRRIVSLTLQEFLQVMSTIVLGNDPRAMKSQYKYKEIYSVTRSPTTLKLILN